MRAVLPPGAEVVPAAARSEFVGGLTRAFDVNLAALSLLALIVGLFLAYNTMTFSVVQRRATIGMARALGVTRAEIVAARPGRGAPGRAGRDRARPRSRGRPGARAGAARDPDHQRPLLRRRRARPGGLAGGPREGRGARPRGDAAGGDRPRGRGDGDAARGRDRSASRWRRGRAGPPARAAAAGVLVLGAGALLVGAAGRSLPGAMRGSSRSSSAPRSSRRSAMVGAAAVAGPWLGRALGLPGRMAARGVVATLSRTGVAVAALMVAVAATVGVGVMIGSFRATVVRWLETSLVADVYVSAPTFVGRPGRRVDPGSGRGRAAPRGAGRRRRSGRTGACGSRRPSGPTHARGARHRSRQLPAVPASWRDRPTPCGRPSRTAARRSCRSPTPTGTASRVGSRPAAADRPRRARVPGGRRVRRLRLGAGRGHDEPADLRGATGTTAASPRSGSCSSPDADIEAAVGDAPRRGPAGARTS